MQRWGSAGLAGSWRRGEARRHVEPQLALPGQQAAVHSFCLAAIPLMLASAQDSGAQLLYWREAAARQPAPGSTSTGYSCSEGAGWSEGTSNTLQRASKASPAAHTPHAAAPSLLRSPAAPHPGPYPRPAPNPHTIPSRLCLFLCPAADVEAKFAKSAWGQKLAKRAAKAAMTDFDRYKAAVQKMKRSAQVRSALPVRCPPARRGGAWAARGMLARRGGGRAGTAQRADAARAPAAAAVAQVCLLPGAAPPGARV